MTYSRIDRVAPFVTFTWGPALILHLIVETVMTAVGVQAERSRRVTREEDRWRYRGRQRFGVSGHPTLGADDVRTAAAHCVSALKTSAFVCA